MIESVAVLFDGYEVDCDDGWEPMVVVGFANAWLVRFVDGWSKFDYMVGKMVSSKEFWLA